MTLLENDIHGLKYMTSPNIAARHAFTTRFGGVSSGYYSSLNLRENSPDDNALVEQNYSIFCTAFGLDKDSLVFSHQVHRDDIRVCTRDDIHSLFTPVPYEADGLITNIPDLPLLVFSADCAEILLFDPVEHAVGAVHAGWRGTMMAICFKAVEKMVSEFGCKPHNIRAAVGPCISRCCFEVGNDVYSAACSLLGNDTDLFFDRKSDGKFMADIKGINRRMLQDAGVTDIIVSDECTMCLHEKYWSHRYTNGVRGTQCAFITL